MSIRERLERALFGATTEERAEIVAATIRRQVEKHVEEIFIRALADDGDGNDSDDDVPPPDANGYWTRTPAGGQHYHAHEPATDNDDDDSGQSQASDDTPA